jgi:hypothetical protein
MAIGKLKRGEKPVIPVPDKKKDVGHIGITKVKAEKINKANKK